MSVIVKSTPAAMEAIANMQRIIAGGLLEQCEALGRAGDEAGNPMNWEGPLADRFRQDLWPATTGTLRALQQDLEKLQQWLDSVQRNIQSAGGAG